MSVLIEKKQTMWLMSPTVLTLLLITIFPLMYALNVSLSDYSLAAGKQVHQFNNFQNFSKVLTDPEFWHSLWVTFKFAGLCLIFELTIGLGLAVVFSERGFKLEPLSMLMILPMAIAPVIVGLVFRWFYSNDVGIIGFLLRSVGISPPAWSSSGVAALFSLVIADVWEWTPYVFLICMAGLKSIEPEIYEAAEIDGARGWIKFKRITLPLMKPTIILVMLLRAIPALKEFDKVFIITDGGPGVATEVTSSYIFKQFLWFNNLGTATAAALILLAVITIVCQILFAYLRKHEEQIQGTGKW
ncbi:MAG: sugar ABC transporter permease [Desulfobacterales bacterium]